MRLDVDILRAEDFLRPLTCQVLDNVCKLAASVVAPAGIALRVLVGEDAAGSFEDRLGGEVLTRNQLELGVLPLGLVLNGLVNLGVNFGQWTRHFICSIHENSCEELLATDGHE